jgi:hypothetical protein
VTAVDAWQSALAAEHAAVYGYALVGARLTADVDAARSAQADHRFRRDRCVEEVKRLGAEPEPAAAAYEPSSPVRSDSDAKALAADIEQGCSAAYLALVALDASRDRRVGAEWLRRSTVARSRWSGELPALPGFEQ